ncbi:MAG: hypothetical protein EXS09_02505 [Gemmataceae bacterium]|nr:hypothetical protein [Gemmataceae bacterium]
MDDLDLLATFMAARSAPDIETLLAVLPYLGHAPDPEQHRANLAQLQANNWFHAEPIRLANLVGRLQGAQNAWANLAAAWNGLPAIHPARAYLAQEGIRLLCVAVRFADAARLLIDAHFVQAKVDAGLVFDLANEVRKVLEHLPNGAENSGLADLGDTLQRDLHFIARHPELLFACVWNNASRPMSVPFRLSLRALGNRPLPPEERRWVRSVRTTTATTGIAPVAVHRVHRFGRLAMAASEACTWLVTGGGGTDTSVRLWDVRSWEVQVVQTGLDNMIAAVAISDDGWRFAYLAKEGGQLLMRVLDRRNGTELVCRAVHPVRSMPPRRISLGTGGCRVAYPATAEGQSGVRIVHVPETGQVTDSFLPAKDAGSVIFFHDGARLLVVTLTACQVWDINGNLLNSIPSSGHESVLAEAVSPDDQHVALSVEAGRVGVWEIATGTEVARRPSPEDRIESLCFVPKRDFLCLCGRGTVTVWNWRTGIDHCILTADPGYRLRDVAALPDGRTIVASAWDGAIRHWDLDTPPEARRVPTGPEPTEVVWTERGCRIVERGPDGVVVRDEEHGRELLRRSDDRLLISPDARLFVEWPAEGQICARDVVTLAERWTVGPLSPGPNRAEFTGDGERLILSSEAGLVVLNIFDGREVLRLDHEIGRLLPDDRLVALQDGRVTLWDLGHGHCLARQSDPYIGLDAEVHALSPNLIALGCPRRGVLVWETMGNTLVLHALSQGDTPRQVSWSDRGRTLMVAEESGVDLWMLPDGTHFRFTANRPDPNAPPHRAHLPQVPSGNDAVVISLPEGGQLRGSREGAVERRNERSAQWEPVGQMPTRVTAIASSGNGRFVASGDSEGNVRCWSVATGTLVHEFRIETPDAGGLHAIYSVAAGPGGEVAACAASGDLDVHIRTTEVASVLRLADQIGREEQYRLFDEPCRAFSRLVFDEKGACLAATVDAGREIPFAVIWDLTAGNSPSVVRFSPPLTRKDRTPPYQWRASPDGRETIVTATGTREVVARYPIPITPLCTCPSGRAVVARPHTMIGSYKGQTRFVLALEDRWPKANQAGGATDNNQSPVIPTRSL